MCRIFMISFLYCIYTNKPVFLALCLFPPTFSSRQKLVKCLQSNPVQILLCVVVLLDAGIVIAQILLDLHSVRGRAHIL